MNKLMKLIKELESKIPEQRVINAKVSKATVGWHIEHSLLTIDGIIARAARSNTAEYQKKFNLGRFFVFTLNKIPRGRAQSPDLVRPASNFDDISLQKHIAKTTENLKQLDNLLPNNYFNHQIFGTLNLKNTKKMLLLHTHSIISIS